MARGWGPLADLIKVVEMPALTPKQKKFIEEYLVDLNATQAAIRAGYSPKTARASAARNMKDVNIQAALQKARERQKARTEITADMVLKELLAIATDRADDMTNSRLKYSNKIKALELLGKHLGLFTEKVSVEMPEGGIVMIPSVKDE